MRYYTIRINDGRYAKYAVESTQGYVLIGFDDCDMQDVYAIFRQECVDRVPEMASDSGVAKHTYLDFVSEDNVHYSMNLLDGGVEKRMKYPLRKVLRQFRALEHKAQKAQQEKADIQARYSHSTIVEQVSFVPWYGRYCYIDKEIGVRIPFRLKKASGKEKKPLVVYLHGAGCIGKDNIKPLLEYLPYCTGLKRKDCHVLIPQCTGSDAENLTCLTEHANGVRNLIKCLAQRVAIDFDRIYLIGCSFGAACTWYSVYNNPSFYAAAIPLMGYFVDAHKENLQLENFKDTAIWAGHAQNDTLVSIEDDATLCNRLQQAECPVTFTVYEKYGHRMCGVFLRKEKWKDWLFDQKRIESRLR